MTTSKKTNTNEKPRKPQKQLCKTSRHIKEFGKKSKKVDLIVGDVL